MIAHRSPDAAQRLRGENKACDDGSAKRLGHAEVLNAVIQRNGEFLRQDYDDEEVDKQHHSVKCGRANDHAMLLGFFS